MKSVWVFLLGSRRCGVDICANFEENPLKRSWDIAFIRTDRQPVNLNSSVPGCHQRWYINTPGLTWQDTRNNLWRSWFEADVNQSADEGPVVWGDYRLSLTPPSASRLIVRINLPDLTLLTLQTCIIFLLLSLPCTPSMTHPFVVFERSSEAHGLNELCEGADFFLCVLGCLLHAVELTEKEGERQWGKDDWIKTSKGSKFLKDGFCHFR